MFHFTSILRYYVERFWPFLFLIVFYYGRQAVLVLPGWSRGHYLDFTRILRGWVRTPQITTTKDVDEEESMPLYVDHVVEDAVAVANSSSGAGKKSMKLLSNSFALSAKGP